MCESRQREVSLQPTLVALDEISPHQPSRGVIREGEVDRLVKELLKVLFGATLWVRSATNNGDTVLVIDKFSIPFLERLFNFCWTAFTLFLLGTFLFTAFFLPCIDFFYLIDIDNRGLVLFSCKHYKSNQLIFSLFIR